MGRASVAYTNKDYESLRRELLARVPQLTDRWTDFNASDLGVVLLELFCGVGDMLTYYLDAQAAEAFLQTLFKLPRHPIHNHGHYRCNATKRQVSSLASSKPALLRGIQMLQHAHQLLAQFHCRIMNCGRADLLYQGTRKNNSIRNMLPILCLIE